MRSPAPIAALWLLVLALGLAGCGGDDSDSTTEDGLGENPSRSDYIAAADEICQRLYEQRDPLENQAAAAAQSGDLDAAADTFENAAAITEQRFAELEGLPRPEGDEQALTEIYDAGGARTAAVALDAAAALRAGDDRAFMTASQEGAANSSKFSKRAIDYGLLVCGRGQAVTIG